MRVGDFVHNVPRSMYGLIVRDAPEVDLVDDEGNIAERVFWVLYDDGISSITGSSFLEVISESR